jgi:hypothetical protein
MKSTIPQAFVVTMGALLPLCILANPKRTLLAFVIVPAG